MNSPEAKKSGTLQSTLVGGLLGGVVGLMGGLLFSGMTLEPPDSATNNYLLGVPGMARSALIIATAAFGAMVGAAVGVVIGAVVGMRAHTTVAARVDPPSDPGITFVNEREPQP